MANRALSDEVEAQIFADYGAGAGGTRALAKRYGTTRTVVLGAIARQRRLKLYGPKPERLYRQKEWMHQKYVVESLGAPEMARLAGCGKTTILCWLDKFGIERRGNSEAHVGIANPSKIMLEAEAERDLVAAYEDGASGPALGEAFGLSQQVVYRILHEHGVVKPSTREKYTLNENAFDVIDNEGAAYWIGFIYADGCVYRDALRVLLKESDGAHLEKLVRFLGSDRPVLYYERKQYRNTYEGEDYALVTFGSRHLAQRLVQLGIIKDRPTIEPATKNVPMRLAHHWIRGYFDGDGSAGRNRPRIRFIGQEYVLAWIDSVIIDALGFSPRNLQQNKSMFTSSYSGSFNCQRLVTFLYDDATVWLERKKDLIDAWPKPKVLGRNQATGQFR